MLGGTDQVVTEILKQCLASERTLDDACCDDSLIQSQSRQHREAALSDERVMFVDSFANRGSTPKPRVGPVVLRDLVQEKERLRVVLPDPPHEIGTFDWVSLCSKLLHLFESDAGSDE